MVDARNDEDVFRESGMFRPTVQRLQFDRAGQSSQGTYGRFGI